MATIHVRFVHGRSLALRLVQWFTKSKWGHVEHVLRDGSLISADCPAGVVHVPAGWVDAPGITAETYAVQVTDAQADAIEKFLHDQVGRGYDLTALLWFVFGVHWQSRTRWFCSELEDAAFYAAGVPLLRDTLPFHISPAKLRTSPLLRPETHA